MLRRIEAVLPWSPVAAIFGVILYEAVFEKTRSLILPGAEMGVVVVVAGLLVVWLAARAALSLANRATLWAAIRVRGRAGRGHMTYLRRTVTPLTASAVICSIVVFASMLVGWRLMPENIAGLFSITDGNYSRWNYEYAYTWGHWFDLTIFNPFSGLGTTFWTNTPWLNPGALVLQLPLPALARITISYLIHLSLLLWSLYCLGRAAGASRLAIVFAALVFVVMFFPPFTMRWNTIVHASIAPFRLVTMAAANFIICSLIIAAHGAQRHALVTAIAVGVMALFWGVYASATYFIFDLIVVGGFAVVLLGGAPHRIRLLASAALIAAAFVATGMAGYIDALASVSIRARPQFAELVNGFKALILDDAVRKSFFANLSTCQNQMEQYLPCLSQPSFPFFALSLAAAVCGTRSRNAVFRAISIYSVLLVFGLWFLGVAGSIHLFGAFHEFSVQHIAFAASVFTVLPLMIAADWLLAEARAFAWPLFIPPAIAAASITLFVVIPDIYVKHYPSLFRAVITGRYKGDAETPIIRYLREQIGLRPGAEFRGSVATYLGQSETMSRLTSERDRYQRIAESPLYLWLATQNPHQNTGLWQFGIPSFDEYAHMITKALVLFTAELLSERPFDYRIIRAYEIRPDILRMIGVRYVLSDAPLDTPGLTEVERLQTGGYWDGKLFLYRLENVNLATWSPTEVTVLADGNALLKAMKSDQQSLQKRVFLSSPPPVSNLTAMKRGSLSFDINEFRFRGEADGWSLALLPLQFSHCWKPVDPAGVSHLVRANYFMTGLIFKGTVDARYKFEFGPLNSQCRKLDASMMN